MKETDITHPAPADAYVFSEENMWTINDGYLEIDSHGNTFPDVPDALTAQTMGWVIAFDDGHAQDSHSGRRLSCKTPRATAFRLGRITWIGSGSPGIPHTIPIPLNY